MVIALMVVIVVIVVLVDTVTDVVVVVVVVVVVCCFSDTDGGSTHCITYHVCYILTLDNIEFSLLHAFHYSDLRESI